MVMKFYNLFKFFIIFCLLLCCISTAQACHVTPKSVCETDYSNFRSWEICNTERSDYSVFWQIKESSQTGWITVGKRSCENLRTEAVGDSDKLKVTVHYKGKWHGSREARSEEHASEKDCKGICGGNSDCSSCLCPEGGGKLKSISLEYTGQGCTASNHDQGDKVTCEGEPNFSQPVSILATDRCNLSSRKLKTFANLYNIQLNDVFTVEGTGNSGDKLPANLCVTLSQNGDIIQQIKFHTSCSVPLEVGDQFGSLIVRKGLTSEDKTCGQACIGEDCESNQCEPVLDGAVFNIAIECLNDSTALIGNSVLADPNGWQYSSDVPNDGVSRGVLGGTFEIIGFALRETDKFVWLVINSNLPLSGEINDKALNGSISWGDVFINLGRYDFLTTHNLGELFGIRFATTNDSGVSIGMYSNILAKSVSVENKGFRTWGAYARKVENLGGTPLLGDFGSNQTYFSPDISLNEIQSGEFLGQIQSVTSRDLFEVGFDFTQFMGTYTFGIKFRKEILIDPCGVIGGDSSSCTDCEGVLCGDAEEDECGVCNGPGPGECGCSEEIDLGCGCGEPAPGECGCSEEIKDSCGECGGAGPVEKTVTVSTMKVKKTAKTLLTRARYFVNRAENCDGNNYTKLVKKTKKQLKKLLKVVEIVKENKAELCSGECKEFSYSDEIRSLKRLAKKLHKLSLNTKLKAVKVCNSKRDPRDSRKGSTFYFNKLKKAIKKLPKKAEVCN